MVGSALPAIGVASTPMLRNPMQTISGTFMSASRFAGDPVA